MECPDADLWIFNATFVLNALDDNVSEGSWHDDGRLVLIEKHVFHPDVVAGIDMFKVTHWQTSPIFVSERFVDLWNASGLEGLRFKQWWSSE